MESKNTNTRKLIRDAIFFDRKTYSIKSVSNDFEVKNIEYLLNDEFFSYFKKDTNNDSALGFPFITGHTYMELLDVVIKNLISYKGEIESLYTLSLSAKVLHLPTNSNCNINFNLFDIKHNPQSRLIEILDSDKKLKVMTIDANQFSIIENYDNNLYENDINILNYIKTIEPYIESSYENSIKYILAPDLFYMKQTINYLDSIKSIYNVFNFININYLRCVYLKENSYVDSLKSVIYSGDFYSLIHELTHALDMQNKDNSFIQDIKDKIVSSYLNSNDFIQMKNEFKSSQYGEFKIKYYSNPSEIFARVVTRYFEKEDNIKPSDNKNYISYDETLDICKNDVVKLIDYLNNYSIEQKKQTFN